MRTFKWISCKENTILPHFEFLPNFSRRNPKRIVSSRRKILWKNFFFLALEEKGEPWPFLLISSDICHKKMLLESLNIQVILVSCRKNIFKMMKFDSLLTPVFRACNYCQTSWLRIAFSQSGGSVYMYRPNWIVSID